MRFRLRTLLIAVAILPPIVAPVSVWVWHKIEEARQASLEPGYMGAVLDDMAVGISVVNVRPGGPASRGGLMPGDVILGVNNQPCSSLSAFDSLIMETTAGTRLKLAIKRNGVPKTISVQLGKRPR